MLKMNPQKLADELKDMYHALDQNGQAAGGLFGLIYAEHLAANSRDRSPNGIARRAGLTCGPDVNTGFLVSQYVYARARDSCPRLLDSPGPRLARENVEVQVRHALDELCLHDKSLLEYEVHEVAICGRLAMYIQRLFPLYDVDIEYNRAGIQTKRLDGQDIRPDVVVHRRGNDDSNLLAMELKKAPVSEPDRREDQRKLAGYQQEFRYRFAIWVELPVGYGTDHTPIIEWIESESLQS